MEVALFIKTPKYQNTNELTYNNFYKRVKTDGGTFEAGSCLRSTIESLGSSFDTLATYSRIELFEDEKISVTSSIQNINDISKIFTDYSQSFTIPASANNNEIFKHWYENSLDDAFDQRLRYDGYIEVDTQTFRIGRWQLESATIKNNRVEDYKITFYGDLKSLMDKFGEDKLNDVREINDSTFEYNGTNVRNLVQSTTAQNVMFPLITSDRVWQYNGGGANDISTSGGAIKYEELFPALKVTKIFEAIATKYNLNFSGTFLNQQKFTKAYLWLKGNDSRRFVSTSQRKQLLFTDNTTSLPRIFNIQDNVYNLLNSNNTHLGSNVYSSEPKFTVIINFPASVNHRIFIYKNDSLFTTLEFTSASTTVSIPNTYRNGSYKIFVESFTPTTYTYSYSFTYRRFNLSAGTLTFPVVSLGSSSGSLNSNINLLNYLPDMKVSDFFSGILKMFNLTAYSTDGVNFTLEQLENWYYLGEIKDLSQYCTTDLNFERIKPYRKINFEYEKSENLLSREFFANNNREYGNLSSTFNTDGADYSIKLPFENLLFSKFTGTDLQVGYALKSDLTPYAPKPIILYLVENKAGTLYFNDGVSTVNINQFMNFGQDCIDTVDLTNNTLNWGVEISSYFLEPINNSLFNNYYLAYLNNLYSLKSRMVKVKMRLPYLELLNLKLNDRVVIRDKRYIINSFTTDLTTFESDFELIQDFRSINFDNGTSRGVSNQAVIFDVFLTSKELLTWTIIDDVSSMLNGISFNELTVKIDVKQNTSGVQRTAAILSNKNDLITITQDA